MNEQSRLLDGPGGIDVEAAVPIAPVPVAPAVRRANPSWVAWLPYLLVISLSVGMAWMKMETSTQIRLLQSQLGMVEGRLEALESQSIAKYSLLAETLDEITHKETSLNATLATVGRAVSDNTQKLVRLSNGTSNADVLDKLASTTAAVRQELNVTNTHINARLNNTIVVIQRIISNATTSMQGIQSNVTSQLDTMTSYLRSTVTDLSATVANAKEVIQNDVNDVRSNIAQYVAITNKQFAAENDFVKYQIAGTFTLLSVLIFMAHMMNHIRHYHKPDIQRRIMAVLWMVPVYSLTSWMALVKPSWEAGLSAFRDLFEAYVIYMFVGLLVAVLSDGLSFTQLIHKLASQVANERHLVSQGEHKKHLTPPCACCASYSPEEEAKAWLWQCQLLGMQFVFVKPLSGLLPFLLELSGVPDAPWWNGGHHINYHSPRLYVLIIQNISVVLAFTGLLSFFHGAEKELEWCNPWPKFLCIKGVVFATFWQNIAIQIMSAYGLVDEKTAAQVQNLLICIEMLIASISHLYVFPHQEWAPTYQRERQRSLLLRDTMALGDFYKDMRRLVTPWEVEKHQSPMHHDVEEPSKEDPILAGLRDELMIRLDMLGDKDGGSGAEGGSGLEGIAHGMEDSEEHTKMMLATTRTDSGGGGGGGTMQYFQLTSDEDTIEGLKESSSKDSRTRSEGMSPWLAVDP